MPITTHRDGRGPYRTSKIEREDLRFGIATELQGHQRQEHGFAGAGRANNERMPDIADVK